MTKWRKFCKSGHTVEYILRVSLKSTKSAQTILALVTEPTFSTPKI